MKYKEISIVIYVCIVSVEMKKESLPDENTMTSSCHRDKVLHHGVYVIFPIAVLANMVAIFVWNVEKSELSN